MVMAGLEFKQELPFKHVYFTPIVRDHLGRKMSKSLGNSPKIKDLIHEYGTDALRFAVVNHTNPGQDIAWKNQHCQVGSHFAHKIWNCGRFFEFIFQKNQWTWKPAPLSSFSHPLSLWFLKKLSVVFDECHKYIQEYEFSKYTQTLYEFTWMEFCDWYIEFIKHETDEQLFQESAQIFEIILLMLNPVIPFITEKIWQCLTSRTQSISLEKFPSFPSLLSPHDQVITSLQECISEVRTLKSQFQIKSGYPLKTSLNPLSPYEKQLLSLTGASTVAWNSTPSKNDLTLPLSDHQSISISQESLVDMTKELKRLSSRKEKLELIIEKTILRINSPEFAQNAPPAVVAGAEAELLKTQQEYKTILKNLEILQS
jgi:valyl-tRNA synthetase